jgi:hypothetical protein
MHHNGRYMIFNLKTLNTMNTLKVLRETSKTRVRKKPYKKSYLYTTEVWFNEKWVDIGHSKTLKEANVICDYYETQD